MDSRRTQLVGPVAIALLLLVLVQPARAAGFAANPSPINSIVAAIEGAFSDLLSFIEPHRTVTVSPPAQWHASGSSESAAAFNGTATIDEVRNTPSAIVLADAAASASEPASTAPSSLPLAAPSNSNATRSAAGTGSYVTQDELTAALAQLQSSINYQLYSSTSTLAAGGIWNAIAAAERINSLAPSGNVPLTITNPTFSGTVSGLTPSEIPDLSGTYLPLTGGTLSGPLTNSSTAASTFAGVLGVGTTTPGSILSVQGVANWTTATSTYYSSGGINLTGGCFSINGTCIGGSVGGVTSITAGTGLTGGTITTSGTIALDLTHANSWTSLQQFQHASTSLFSAYGPAYFGATATSSFNSSGQLTLANLASAVLGVNSNGQVVATTSIGTNLLTGTLGTINGTTLNAASSIAITAASSTLLGDNDVFSGADSFTNAASNFAGTWQGLSPSHFQTAGTYLTALGNYATTTGTAISISTSTLSWNGLTLGNTFAVSANGITVTPTVSGTISNSGLSNSTISGVSLGSNLANLSATDNTLTFSGAYNGATVRTVGLNLANANAWTGLQQFQNASTTLFSAYGPAYFGATATSSFGTNGSLTLAGPETQQAGFVSQASSTVVGNFTATGNIGTGGLVLSPAANSTSQALSITQSGPTTSTVAGPFLYNSAYITNRSDVTGDNPLHRSIGWWLEMDTGGANQVGAAIDGYFLLNHNQASTSTKDHIALVANVTSNATDTSGGQLYGFNGVAIGSSGADGVALNAQENDVEIDSGASFQYRNALRLVNQGTGQGSVGDAAIAITSTLSSGLFKNLILLSNQLNDFPIDTSGNLISSDVSGTIGNGIKLPNVTVTGNIFSFPHYVVAGSGNTGIGTTTPNILSYSSSGSVLSVSGQSSGFGGVLELASPQNTVNGGDEGLIRFINGNTENARIYAFNNSANGDAGALSFSTRATGGALTEQMRITGSGNVGIGTTTPQGTLDVFSNNNASTPYGGQLVLEGGANQIGMDIYNVQSGAHAWGIWSSGPSASPAAGLNFYDLTSAAVRFTLSNAGNVGVATLAAGTANSLCYNTTVNSGFNTLATCSSDQRLKQNITPLDASSTLAQLLALNPVSFNWNPQFASSSPEQFGLIAQQVQQVWPNLISTTSPTALTPDGTLSLNFNGLFGPIIGSIQEIADIGGQFEQNLIAWLGNAQNGIEDLFAKNIHAQNELCVGKSDGSEECINGDQLAQLLSNSSGGAVQVSAPVTVVSGSTSTRPTITINGANPAVITVGDTYSDLGATAEDSAGHSLSVETFLNGSEVPSITLDTGAPATGTIEYVATDTWGNTATGTRTVIIEAAPAITPAGGTASSTATTTVQ